MDLRNEVSFRTIPGFCPDCGSILPLIDNHVNVICYACLRKWGALVFGDMKMSYTVMFNNDSYFSTKDTSNIEEELTGPIVNRPCPQCNNNKMFYFTLQLRSADEGQTIFYTCTKCKFKETENS